jgi:hypothetical protein
VRKVGSNSYYHYEDPGLYYTQHLRGFFRDWGRQKVAAEAKLKRDLRTIEINTQANAAGADLLHRDVHFLEILGAAVPSAINQQLDDVYLAAFGQRVPTPQLLSQLRSNLVTILGPAGIASRIATVNQLVADVPAFSAVVGVPSSNVQTIVDDVRSLVDAGGGETLNPFKITIRRVLQR